MVASPIANLYLYFALGYQAYGTNRMLLLTISLRESSEQWICMDLRVDRLLISIRRITPAFKDLRIKGSHSLQISYESDLSRQNF